MKNKITLEQAIAALTLALVVVALLVLAAPETSDCQIYKPGVCIRDGLLFMDRR